MIEVRNLTKRYGSLLAADHLSFTVGEGQIYGFLGPNGAGKTTTMNMITGCISATEGQALIGGYDIFEDPIEAKRLIGYLPEIPPLYLDLTVEEYLRFVGELKGLKKKKEREEQIDEVLVTTDTVDVYDRPMRALSKGYRQRVGLAQALIGHPKVLIFDEPTVGLDPKQIIEIRDLIRSLGGKHTIILSSHILSEVSAICDHVLIISHGKLVANDTPDNLSRLITGSNKLTLLVRGTEEAVRAALAPIDKISALSCEETDGLLELSVESAKEDDIRESLFYAFAEARCPILEMTHSTLTLEDVFLELTSDTAFDTANREKDPTDGGEKEAEA